MAPAAGVAAAVRVVVQVVVPRRLAARPRAPAVRVRRPALPPPARARRPDPPARVTQQEPP